MNLDVAIVTWGKEGLERIAKMNLPAVEGVSYVISWQQHEEALIPAVLSGRGDIRIERLNEKGISNNRNNSIKHATGDIILLGDDDLIYRDGAFREIIEEFEKDPELDVALFKVDFLNQKKYPQEKYKIGLPFPKDYYVSSVEIAIRRDRIKDLRFYPLLGLGSPEMHCGEEELFIISCIKRGLNCKFIPVTICRHPSPTTGNQTAPGNLKGMGFVIPIIYPLSWILRIPLKAWRSRDGSIKNFLMSLKYMFSGSLQSKFMLSKVPKQYRW